MEEGYGERQGVRERLIKAGGVGEGEPWLLLAMFGHTSITLYLIVDLLIYSIKMICTKRTPQPIALSPCTTLPCPHIVSRSHWLALFRFTLPHSATLPFVWLSRWLSITLCHSHHALLSHTPPSRYLAPTVTLTHGLSRTVAHWLTIVINMLFT